MAELRGTRGVRYRVSRDKVPLAYGRACVLYLVEDSGDVKKCLKLFKAVPRIVGAKGGHKEFLREFAAQQSLRHPNILPVLDVGSEGREGPPFIVYPFCDGGNLREKMAGREFMPLSEALEIIRPIALALDHAHDAGFIHGDVKPENILFSTDRGYGPYLSDFGMSRYYVEDSVGNATSVAEEEFRGGGSYTYMTPEQLDVGAQSVRSDIYALAVVAFELIIGKGPFADEGGVYRQMRAKVEGAANLPRLEYPNIPESVWNALSIGLARAPRDRPGRASDFCRLLAGDEHLMSSSAGRKSRKGSRMGRWWGGLGVKEKAAIVTTAIAGIAAIVAALIEILPDLLK